MRLNNTLREFLELVNSRGVDYVIVGTFLRLEISPSFT